MIRRQLSSVSNARNDADVPAFHQPRLLVSVRSAEEARLAIEGGAEVIDVKEPSRGSLGMAPIERICEIASSVAEYQCPVSVALGEMNDWSDFDPIPSLPAGIRFAKLGLSQSSNRVDWRQQWVRVRDEFQRRSTSKLNWVAVAYADAEEAHSPAIDEVIAAAVETKCCGLLLDTWTKKQKSLLDWINVSSLSAIAEQCHSEGLFFAIAGKLNLDSLKSIYTVPADLLAIRSAACTAEDRVSGIDSSRVAGFLSAMRMLTANHRSRCSPVSS